MQLTSSTGTFDTRSKRVGGGSVMEAEGELREYLHGLPNEELLMYAKAGPHEHHPEAIALAQEELKARQVPSQDLAALEAKVQARLDDQARTAAAPLSWTWRAVTFLSGLFFGIPLLILIPSWLRFRENGERRKNQEMWISSLIGFGAACYMSWAGLHPLTLVLFLLYGHG
jgi:hypothetical protein